MKRRLFGMLLLSLMIIGFGQTLIAFAAPQAQFTIPHLVVNTSFLNVRSGDGPQYSVIVVVTGGTELPVLGMNSAGTWFLVTTPVGAGWVDVSFTLARGDFRNVPVIAPTAPQVQTPVTIGLPQSVAMYPLPGTLQTGIQTSTNASLNVISVNLRTQPADNGSVIGILFRDDNAHYAIVGYAYDSRGVHWAAIVVPGMGTGWVEEPKLNIEPGSVAGGTPTVVVPSAAQAAARIVINTSYQNVRSGPGGQFGVLAVVPGGTTLAVYGVTTDTSWYLVRGDFGQGWVSSEFVLFRGSFSSVPVIHSAF